MGVGGSPRVSHQFARLPDRRFRIAQYVQGSAKYAGSYLGEKGGIIAGWTGAKERNGSFKVLTRCRKVSGAESNHAQYAMRTSKYRRSLGLLRHGKDSLCQFSRRCEITPVEAKVGQRREC